MAVVDEVLADLTAEADELEATVAGLTTAAWALPTPAPGWTIAHQIAHLASTDAMVTLAAADPAEFERRMPQAGDDFDAVIQAGLTEQLSGSPDELLARWRVQRAAVRDALAAVPPGRRVPWLVMPMSAASLATTRLMEVFAHGQDIADALGLIRGPADRIHHVARLGVRTRDFSFLARGLTPPAQEFRVELTAPSGALWVFGPDGAPQRVSGPAADFCLLVTRRRHRDDLALAAAGPEADRWLDIAQAYVGPPGPGRAPGQFAPATSAGHRVSGAWPARRKREQPHLAGPAGRLGGGGRPRQPGVRLPGGPAGIRARQVLHQPRVRARPRAVVPLEGPGPRRVHLP